MAPNRVITLDLPDATRQASAAMMSATVLANWVRFANYNA
jgi:hypothetical protein